MLDPSTGMWVSDVGGAILGREAQTQQNFQQIGQRADINRKQKLEDDELKRFNKKIRGHAKVMIASDELPITQSEADLMDTATLEGMISGRGTISKLKDSYSQRDLRTSQQEIAEENIAAAQGERERKAARDHTTKEALQLFSGDISEAFGSEVDREFVSGVSPHLEIFEQNLLNEQKVLEQRGQYVGDVKNLHQYRLNQAKTLKEFSKSYLGPWDRAKEIGYGGEAPTPTERRNPKLMDDAEGYTKQRQHFNVSKFGTQHDLTKSLDFFAKNKALSAGIAESKELGIFLGTGGLTTQGGDPFSATRTTTNRDYGQPFFANGQWFQTDRASGRTFQIGSTRQGLASVDYNQAMASDNPEEILRAIDNIQDDIDTKNKDKKTAQAKTISRVDKTKIMKDLDAEIEVLEGQQEALRNRADALSQRQPTSPFPR